MTLNKWIETLLLTAGLILGFAGYAHAEQSAGKEAVQDIKKGTKEGVNDVKDAACPLVNGKVVCAGKKVKHKVQNGVGEVKDAVDAN